MLYVYITEQCRQDANRISTLDSVEGLADKLVREQSTLGLERHPSPFLKKRFGRTRLIIAEVFDGDDVVLCFLRHVYKYEIGNDYAGFFGKIRVPHADDPDLVLFLEGARAQPVETKQTPSGLELEYLVLDRSQEMGQLTVLESPLWIQTMREITETRGKQGLLTPIWEVLETISERVISGGSDQCEQSHEKYDLKVLYRHFPGYDALFLVAPIESSEAGKELGLNTGGATKLLEDCAQFSETELLRNAARAYPDFILYDREIWESTQASIDANLALSPEESDVLTHVLDPTKAGGFPLFINGRPGSGKSTILQYLFAEYLHAHLARAPDHRLAQPPLYLTYNERLLDNAKKLIEDVFRCGAEKLAASETVDLGDTDQRAEFDRAFVYFREFLLSMVDGGGFDRSKYVGFHGFRGMYTTLLQGPDPKLRKLAPEVAWHTLRTIPFKVVTSPSVISQ